MLTSEERVLPVLMLLTAQVAPKLPLLPLTVAVLMAIAPHQRQPATQGNVARNRAQGAAYNVLRTAPTAALRAFDATQRP